MALVEWASSPSRPLRTGWLWQEGLTSSTPEGSGPVDALTSPALKAARWPCGAHGAGPGALGQRWWLTWYGMVSVSYFQYF